MSSQLPLPFFFVKALLSSFNSSLRTPLPQVSRASSHLSFFFSSPFPSGKLFKNLLILVTGTLKMSKMAPLLSENFTGCLKPDIAKMTAFFHLHRFHFLGGIDPSILRSPSWEFLQSFHDFKINLFVN